MLHTKLNPYNLPFLLNFQMPVNIEVDCNFDWILFFRLDIRLFYRLIQINPFLLLERGMAQLKIDINCPLFIREIGLKVSK